MRHIVSHTLTALATAILVLLVATSIIKKEPSYVPCAVQQENFATDLFSYPQNQKNYVVRQFDFSKIQGLTLNQLNQHHKLYEGYVNKRNEIQKELASVDRTKTSTSYSALRALKVPETFTLNGVILHELYFENCAGKTEMGPKTKALLEENFGSVEKFKEDLFACASCSRGWILTGFCIYDGGVYNFLLDAHNETVPLLTLPLLVIDTYEHAYMIDFGIQRAEYLKTLWENINWNSVEQRVKNWVEKFKK